MENWSNVVAQNLSFCAVYLGLCLCACFIFCTNTASAQRSKVRIQKIHFKGNDHYPDIILKNFIYSKEPNFLQKSFNSRKEEHYIDRNEIQNDQIRLSQFYRQRGFPKVDVKSELIEEDNGDSAQLYFTIYEGLEQRVKSFRLLIDSNADDSLIIAQDEAFQKALEKQAYRIGSKYESIVEAEVRAALLNPLKRIGYPFTKLNLKKTFSDDLYEVHITATITAGSQRQIGEYIVKGLERLDEKYILKEAALSTGTLYDEEKIKSAQKELFNHPMIRFVTMSVEPSEHDEQSAEVQINVRERAIRTIQLTGGVGIEETLRGQVSWIHRDLFGSGHQFNSEMALSFIEQRASASYQIPWLFNTHSSLVVSPFVQNMIEPGFSLLRGGLSNTIIYRATDAFTGSFAYNLSRNSERLTQQNVTLPDSIQSYNVASINTGILYTSGYVKDREGWVIRANNELSGLVLDATYPFQKFSLDIRHYSPTPWRNGQFAFKIEGGSIFSTIAQDSLPRNIRFFLGGTSSIRGWNRQQLGPREARFEDNRFQAFIPKGGRNMMAFSIELRQDMPSLFNGFGVAAFLDGGNIWSSRIDFSSEPLRFGTGIGLRYKSPIGPLRVDFGYKLNPSDIDRGFYEGIQYTNGSRWAIHFSLGQAF